MASIADLLGIQWERGEAAPAKYSPEPHVVKQAKVKGFSMDSVMRAANDPHHTSENFKYPGQMRHVRDGICAVVHPGEGRIITVYKDQEQTAMRRDQRNDPEAQAHARKAGKTSASRS
jgi:hypothetical protein